MTVIFATEKTRDVLWELSTGLEILWYALVVISIVVFAVGVLRPLLKYRAGHSDLPPWRELGRRLTTATRELASQRPMRRRTPLAGWAHAATFYGFVVLLIGTTILSINTDITERFFGWRFFEGNFYLGYSLVLDVFGAAFVIGLLMFLVRRVVVRPRNLDYKRPDRDPEDPAQDRRMYRWGDRIFLFALIYLGVTGFLLEGVRIAMEDGGYDAYNPVGWAASLLFGQGAETDATVRHVLWWSHGIFALVFVAAIPFTKAKHMLTSYASLVLRDAAAGKRLRAIPDEQADDPAGYATLSDFTLTHLLQLDACTKCGKCHTACPANATGLPLSPRDLILDLREQAEDALRPQGVGGVLGSLLTPKPKPGFALPVVGQEKVREDTLWSCMQCNACVEICPVGIEQAPIINQMRRSLVEQGDIEPALQQTLTAIQKSGNSFGSSRRQRGKWTEELGFEVKDARQEPVDVLWFVGDYASFDPRSQRVTRSIARLLAAAEVDFGILYDGERNSGNDVRRVGEEGLFEALAEHNIGVLSECDFNRIVTSDPHSLNTLRNEYSEFGAELEVMHHTAFLHELLEAGRLTVQEPVRARVTYHDPCYLGRFNGGYDAPREILEMIGCEIAEMPRNRDNSFCCGAGGGRIWMTKPEGHERPSENRIREALTLGPLDYFVVSCPKDVTMYEDAIKTTNSSAAMQLRELTELVEQATAGHLAVAS